MPGIGRPLLLNCFFRSLRSLADSEIQLSYKGSSAGASGLVAGAGSSGLGSSSGSGSGSALPFFFFSFTGTPHPQSSSSCFLSGSGESSRSVPFFALSLPVLPQGLDQSSSAGLGSAGGSTEIRSSRALFFLSFFPDDKPQPQSSSCFCAAGCPKSKSNPPGVLPPTDQGLVFLAPGFPPAAQSLPHPPKLKDPGAWGAGESKLRSSWGGLPSSRLISWKFEPAGSGSPCAVLALLPIPEIWRCPYLLFSSASK